jgi:hypothetical protein
LQYLDNLNNVRPETSRNFREKEEHLKKILSSEINSKNKNATDIYRGINEFEKG